MSILLVLLILGGIIGVHELGHFLAMRRYRVAVRDFSIGFGPAIYSRKIRDGTTFTIRAIPIGGYVMPLHPIFHGSRRTLEDGSIERVPIEAPEGMTFYNELPPGQRLVVDGAGVFMNGATAAVAMTCILLGNGINDQYAHLVAFLPPVIREVLMGIAVGFGGLFYIVYETLRLVFSGDILDHISGPVGIFRQGTSMLGQGQEAAGQIVAGGGSFLTAAWAYLSRLLSYVMVISLGVGAMNLFPLAGLDGGKIVISLFRVVTRRRLEHLENVLNFIGMILVIILMGVVTFREVFTSAH